MRRFFDPVVSLMNRLKYPRKFALMAFVISLPFLTFMYLLINEINMDTTFAKKESLGARYNQAIILFLRDLQQHRGMANAFISGDTAFKEKLLKMQAHIEDDIRAIDELDKKYGKAITIRNEWQTIKQRWQAIRKQLFSMKAQDSFDMHTSLIDDVLSLMVRVADISGLTLDSYIDSFYLMDTAVNKIPLVAEYAGRIRGIGVGAIIPGKLAPAGKAGLIVLSGLCRSELERVNSNMHKVFQHNPGLEQMIGPLLRNTDTGIYNALEMLEKRVINTDEIRIQPAEYFDSFSKAVNKILKLHDAVTSALNKVLKDRIERLTKKKVYIEIFAMLTVLVIVYIFAGNYFSVMDSLTSLSDASRRMGSGDLRAVVFLKTKDEMKLLADSFNDMAGRLAEVVEELKRSNTELEHFAYLASHDLKSPLLAVGSDLKLFQRRYKGRLDEEADQFISDAIKSTIRMEKLISALLAYSRVRTQGKPFEPTDCSEALNISLANLKADIEGSGVEITHDALPKVMADPIQLVQLFQNLLGNAVKFRGQGKPHIHVSAMKNEKEWVFSVRDNGIGIPGEHIEKIFEIFNRPHGEKYPGTGIGLAICKKIVERHSGRIWVESEPGKGAVFFFTIPVGEEE
jgi:signal transduction histidine kinase